LRQPCAGAASRRYDAGDRLFRLRPAIRRGPGARKFFRARLVKPFNIAIQG
jgi:hypothetical protein